MAVFDVQRLYTTLLSLDTQTAAVADAVSKIESSIATLPVLTDLTANASALPVSGDFSNTPYSASVDYKGDVTGPNQSNTFLVSSSVAEANTITSYGLPTGNTATEYHLTLQVPEGAETPITFWMSTQPGSNSIVKNAYITDRAQAVSVDSNVTIKFIIGGSSGILTSNNIYTHLYLLEDQTYYMNFTYNTFGNFSSSRMDVDFEVPAGAFETSLTISGLTI